MSTQRENDWRVDDLWVVVMLLLLLATVAAAWKVGYEEGKYAADRWWQADEAKKAQTIRNWVPHWGMDGTFCGDNSGCYTMKDGLCVSGDCFGKPQAVCYEPKWTGTGPTLVPCPEEQPKQ